MKNETAFVAKDDNIERILREADSVRKTFLLKSASLFIVILVITLIATHFYLPNLPLWNLIQALMLSTFFLLLLYTIFSAPFCNTIKLWLSLAFFALLVLALDKEKTDAVFMLSVGPILGLFIVHHYLEIYRQTYRSRLTRTLLQACNDTLKYIPNSFVSPHHIIESRLAAFNLRKLTGNDKVTGKFNEVYYEYSYLDSNVDPTFKGIVINATFPSSFVTSLFLNPQNEEPLNHLEQIAIDHGAFDQSFQTYGTDRTNVMALLNEAIRNKLLTVQKEFDSPIMFSVSGQKLWMLIPFSESLETLPLFHSLLTNKTLISYVCLSHAFEPLLAELIANPNIWENNNKTIASPTEERQK